MELEQLIDDWKKLSIRNAELEETNKRLASLLKNQKLKSCQRKLASNYRIGYVGLIVLPLLAVLLYFILDFNILFCLFYAVFGMLAGSYDLWFRSYILKYDYIDLPVIEALRHATLVMKYQDRAVMISSASAGILIAVFLYMIYDPSNFDLLAGAIVGGIVGGFIGVKKYLTNRRLARQMVAEINASLENCDAGDGI